jgi:hypothetical protein
LRLRKHKLNAQTIAPTSSPGLAARQLLRYDSPLEEFGLHPLTLMTNIAKIEALFALVSMSAQLTEELGALRPVAAHKDTGLAHT